MKRCPSCSREVADDSRFCSSCGAAVDLTSAPTETSFERGDRSADLSPESRFIPGTVLAKRYRIISLLGRGGMGEVYRADDLKLGQPVALKFLPSAVQRDRARLDRFLNEVKVALKVTHPNVCRVYDIGEVDGQHYISMEYVDGEDLASLLRRIGRLPQDKAVQLARQLCAGLAAAHEEGILHRDLKPANVMIDGRGRAKITDFGLASLAEVIEGDEVRAGTPQYMSPEQHAGKEVTVQSDIYSLGLVLYELFTGKRAFEGKTPAEIARQQEQSSPTSPSSHVEGLDQTVGRIILRCLEKEPSERPPAAIAVAAALPGGDLLAAALAAGETPSPEMVAAAGPRGGISFRIGLACLFTILIGLVVCAHLHPHMTLYGRIKMTKSAQALKENARQIVDKLGYADPPADSASSMRVYFAILRYLEERDDSSSRWDPLSDPSSFSPMTLEYRRSQRMMVPRNFTGEVWFDDPPNRGGDIRVQVTPEGQLSFLEVTPPQYDHESEPAPETDWGILFDLAGLDMESFEPTESTVTRIYADRRAAWSGELPTADGMPVRIETASYRGKPVYFEIVLPTDPHWSAEPAEREPVPALLSIGSMVEPLQFFVPVFVAIFLAVRNIRLGRGDRKGTLRLAVVIAGLSLLRWIFGSHHVPDLRGELELLGVAFSRALLDGFIAWIAYIAIEPHVRRLWPTVLLGWSRLIAGRLRDPMIGRDLLIGFTFGVVIRILFYIGWRSPEWFDLPSSFVWWFGLDSMLGGRWAFAEIFEILVYRAPHGILDLLLFLILRIVFRKQWLAALAYAAIIAFGIASAIAGMGSEAVPAVWLIGIGLGLLQATLFLVLMLRFGLVALMAAGLLSAWFKHFPITADASAPYFGTSLFALAALAAIAIAAFFHSSVARSTKSA